MRLGRSAVAWRWSGNQRLRSRVGSERPPPARLVANSEREFLSRADTGGLAVEGHGDSGFVLCIDDCVDTSVVPQTVYWAQGELGWEGMLRNGFTFRASSGFANVIGSRLWHCSEYAAHLRAPAASALRPDVRARSSVLIVRQVLRRPDQMHNAQKASQWKEPM